ncbi:hypothetical protein AC1031_000374 [Aphanomyces cochlioides]|nr:hypothetical protein AC1031_000374 [Aphanomyces cochlioides]
MGKSSSDESERSPLLRAMRNSYQEETVYSSIHGSTGSYVPSRQPTNDENPSSMRVFRPIIYAEKSLGVLLNSVVFNALCWLVGFALITLNADGVFGPTRHWNWWLVFLPFWIGNFVMIVAHVLSIRSAGELRQWAESDALSNEPLLPLLRKILIIYAVSIPLCVLLLWAELAFCAILSNATNAISVYVAFAPLMIIEVAYIVRYLLCKSRSTLPGASWFLLFAFTLMLAYNSDIIYRNKTLPLASAGFIGWSIAFSPLFVLQLLLCGSLLVVLYSEAAGIYKMNSTQLGATVLYTISLGTAAIGQVMLLEHIEFQVTKMDVASILLFVAWLAGSCGLYLICRQEVAKLMASRGGAVPVPLTRTAQGWVTNHAVTDRWMLLGDIPLTEVGLATRYGNRKRTASDIESELNSEGYTWLRQMCSIDTLRRWCCWRHRQSMDALSSDEHPEGRLKNIKRCNSGSYSDVAVDVDVK